MCANSTYNLILQSKYFIDVNTKHPSIDVIQNARNSIAIYWYIDYFNIYKHYFPQNSTDIKYVNRSIINQIVIGIFIFECPNIQNLNAIP